MQSDKVSRRVFLTVVSTGAAATGLLAACGGPKKEFTCTDTASLSPADKTTREAVKYMDRSGVPGKKCDGCQQYQPGAAGQCGGCKVVKGPIHPEGYCTLWAAKA